MFENVKAIVEAKVGDDTVASFYINDLDKSSHWLAIAENTALIVEITDMGWQPPRGCRWTGSEFEYSTHRHPLLPGMLYFAFVINDVCVYVHLLDPAQLDQAAIAAAYRSGVTFEVYYGRPE